MLQQGIQQPHLSSTLSLYLCHIDQHSQTMNVNAVEHGGSVTKCKRSSSTNAVSSVTEAPIACDYKFSNIYKSSKQQGYELHCFEKTFSHKWKENEVAQHNVWFRTSPNLICDFPELTLRKYHLNKVHESTLQVLKN